jgi:hypothetical protein
VRHHREAAHDDVAELMAAQLARRGHGPAHAHGGADLLRVIGARRTRADDLLHRDDVGVDALDHAGDAGGIRAAVHAARSVNVVGGDAEVDKFRRGPCGFAHC